MKTIYILIFLLLTSPIYAENAPKPLWSTYGTVVNDTQGNATQQNPKIINDDYGGNIIAWEDGRAGYFDIYVQKINSSGSPVWAQNGLAACLSSGNQNFPEITSDGAGGAIIVWQDYTNENSDIHAQHINYAGTALWGKNGAVVCSATAGQFAPQIISDGSGGAIIAWHDYRGGTGEDIYAQRINAGGTTLWPADGVPISTASGTQWYPRIVGDNAGGAYIAWTDGRASSSDNNIYAQRIDSSGNTLWGKDGLTVCSAPNNQENPDILNVADGVIITWQDSRSGNQDIYAQKIEANGKFLWGADGISACSFPYAQEHPKLSSDGEDGAIIVWTDQREIKSDIYGQRIYRNGSIAWQDNGKPIVKAHGTQENPRILSGASNSWIIIWEDDRSGSIDLYAKKINGVGTTLWENDMPIVAARESQKSAAAVGTPQGNVVIAWEDSRSGNNDIFAQALSANGAPIWNAAEVTICSAQGSVIQQNAQLALSKNGSIVVVFEDARSGYFNIYAQKIDVSGNLSWGSNGIAVAKVSANQSNPQIVADGAGGAIICWQENSNKDFPSIQAQHLSSSGEKVWAGTLSVVNVKSSQTKPLMVSDGAGGAIIAWEDNRDVLSLQDIYAQRVSAKGTLVWYEKGKVVISANGDQTDITMISDGQKGAILAWTDYRSSNRNPDIYAQRIAANGHVVWKETAEKICAAPDVQRAPKIIGDGAGGSIIAWTDKAGGSYDIYAQRLDKKGRSLWASDGIPINQLSRTQQNGQFGNNGIIAWEDYRYGNWDIYAAAFSPQGKLLWQKDGVPVALIPHTQYALQAASWKNGSAIIAWEDYRSGNYYEVFMQQLSSQGLALWGANGIKNQTRDGARVPQIISDINNNRLYLFWEDYSNGGRALQAQSYLIY
ncbi:hypothetical protein A3H38_04505 [candidate division WOR-1 bacterium RIFCSPLOWO2_02_FULL_46_20]|uniref:Bulb-type lectin domain-containing protein n=1 Tax=candidate division WOR-1 bacterium RIFCSPLOWO2_02_FULL_46_20 TaxID=1802567 RepID=A0A1F4RGK5_UNCSA|nr:MAG: hypothetical protein A3H38_04505 [candidate division WOR-1 bacterium RIFCSPLOWO2_02_FULL_46_20]